MATDFYEQLRVDREFGWTPVITEMNGGLSRIDSYSPLGYVRFTLDQMDKYFERPSSGQETPTQLKERLKGVRDEADRLLKVAEGAVRERLQRVRDEADRLLQDLAGEGNADGRGGETQGGGNPAPASDCGTFDVGCHLNKFFTGDTAKDLGKRVGLVLLAVVLLAVAIISLR